MKRRLASLSPLLATLLLTSAVFLLPATTQQRQAQASGINYASAQLSSLMRLHKPIDTDGISIFSPVQSRVVTE